MNIAVFGLGKLGAPMVAVFASKGHSVIGYDTNHEYVAALGVGQSPVKEVGLSSLLQQNRDNIRGMASTLGAVSSSELIFVVVPTPSNPDGRLSTVYIESAAASIGAALRVQADDIYRVIVLTSTIMPKQTEDVFIYTLESISNKKCGKNFGVCYNPEFIALGSVIRDMQNPDFVLIGQSDKIAGDRLMEFYTTIIPMGTPVLRMSLPSAELTKLAVNTYVTTKISYANMLAEISERIPGADAHTVAVAVGTDSRIGQKYLQPATAYGGPCFPRDNHALIALAKSLGASADIAEATDRINRRQTEQLADKIYHVVGGRGTVAILGLAYKPNTPVCEESAGVHLANLLCKRGVPVVVYDSLGERDAINRLEEDVIVASTIADCLVGVKAVAIMIPCEEFKELQIETGNVFDLWSILRSE